MSQATFTYLSLLLTQLFILALIWQYVVLKMKPRKRKRVDNSLPTMLSILLPVVVSYLAKDLHNAEHEENDREQGKESCSQSGEASESGRYRSQEAE